MGEVFAGALKGVPHAKHVRVYLAAAERAVSLSPIAKQGWRKTDICVVALPLGSCHAISSASSHLLVLLPEAVILFSGHIESLVGDPTRDPRWPTNWGAASSALLSSPSVQRRNSGSRSYRD